MSESQRIFDMPIDLRDGVDRMGPMSARFRTAAGAQTLHAHQALALTKVEECGGGLLPLAVGSGKTLVGLLAPKVLGYADADVVYVVPASLKKQMGTMIEAAARDWNIARPTVVSYAYLSQANGLTWLADTRPKRIVRDEFEQRSNKTARRTARFLRYCAAYAPAIVAMSGTPAKRSILDYAHISNLALGEQSPTPRPYSTLQGWARVLDVNPMAPPDRVDFGRMAGLLDRFGDDKGGSLQEQLRRAYGRRLRTSPGVVVTTGSSYKGDVFARRMMLPMPEVLTEAIANCEADWSLPDGTFAWDLLRQVAAVRQLAQGFYYQTVWPNGVIDWDWLDKRKALVDRLDAWSTSRYRGLDSPGLFKALLRTGELDCPEWQGWLTVADRPEPDSVPVWLTHEVIDAAVEHAYSLGRPCIVWAGHRAVGKYLSTKMPTALGGEDVPDADVVCLSISSHYVGLNLQRYNANVVLVPPSSHKIWEQLIGRTARQGQESSDVLVHYAAWIPQYESAWAQAVRDAEFDRDCHSTSPQVLLAQHLEDV